MNERVIEEAKAYINNVFKNNADGHDTNHSIRVYKNACKIAEGYIRSGHLAGNSRDPGDTPAQQGLRRGFPFVRSVGISIYTLRR